MIDTTSPCTSTELVPFDPIASTSPALPAAAATLDLVGLICTGLKPKSAAGYLADYRAFARFTGDPEPSAALWRLLRLDSGPAHALALAYLSDMEARKLSPATVSRRLAALRRAVDRARVVGLTSLALEVESPKTETLRDCSGPGDAGFRKMLDLAELRAAAGRRGAVRDVAILHLLYDRALRRGEVVGLDFPEDVDLTRPGVRVLGKGKREKQWLTINDRTRAALARWLEVRGEFPGALFHRTDRTGPTGRLDGESINRLVKALAKRARLPREVRAHGLRHAAITAALDGGHDVRDVKAFSRHGRIDTVLIYDDRRKDVGGAITRSIGRAKGPRARGGNAPVNGR